MLFLTNDDVKQLLTMEKAMAALRSLYEEIGKGNAVSTARQDLIHPLLRRKKESLPGGHYLKTMCGGFVSGETVALRLTSDCIVFHKKFGNLRMRKEPVRDGKWLGLVFLFSMRNGDLIAILQDGLVQRMRVGATSGIADDYLAKRDSGVVGILGSGAQARYHMIATSKVRKIEKAFVWSPNRRHREAFCDEMQKVLGVRVLPTENAKQVAQEADLFITATDSRRSFVPSSWLRPGMHVSTLQPDELTMDACKKIDNLVVHTQLTEETASSNLLKKVEGRKMRIRPYSASASWKNLPTLSDLVVERAPRRKKSDVMSLTGFINNNGIGSQFAAIGSVLLKLAIKRGLGVEIKPDSFLQDIRG